MPLDEPVLVVPLMFTFNRHLIAYSRHADLGRLEVANIQVHFEIFVIVANLLTRNAKHA